MNAFTQVPAPSTAQLKTAILSATQYFQAQRDSISPDAYLIYHFLEGRFGIPPLESPAAYIQHLQADTRRWTDLQPFLRILQPSRFRAVFLKNEDNLDGITAAGVWYDHLHPKRELAQRILAMDFKDGYNITHAFLALTLTEKYFGARRNIPLHARLVEGMDSLIQLQAPTLCDVQIEAFAFRQWADPSYQPPSSQIARLIAQQAPQGSWEYCASYNPAPSHHATVLALWALLEYDAAGYVGKDFPFLHLGR